MTRWALQDAKARFSEVVARAQREGPQCVTKHGRETVIVIATDDFRRWTRRDNEDDLVSFFRNSPLADLDARWLARVPDRGREIAL